MADLRRLKTFLEVTGGGRSAGSTRATQAEPVVAAADEIGVNGASVNDIQRLVDYVPPPEQGPPAWAANRVLWQTALRETGVDTVANDETAYEAVAFKYHSMGGELVTAEDNEEEIEPGQDQDASGSWNSWDAPVTQAPPEDQGDELEIEIDDGTDDDIDGDDAADDADGVDADGGAEDDIDEDIDEDDA